MPLVLFETSESVIELLWDIALAFFIVRTSIVYYLLTAALGVLTTYLLYTRVEPIHHLTTPQSEKILIPAYIVLTTICARAVTSYYEIPPVRQFRVAIGLVATLLMILSEAILGVALYHEGWGDWLLETDIEAGAIFGAALVWFAAAPWALMALERKPGSQSTSHGHENKNVLHAVPTVSVSEKTGKSAHKKSE